jgi:alkaline phosphatase D
MVTRRLALLVLVSCVAFPGCRREAPEDAGSSSTGEYAQSAPDDAYQEGSPFAYYGSENEWSRRLFSERTADTQYKRRGQRQMLAILDGQPEKAAELCRARLRSDPRDAESLFVLTVAQARMGQLDSAMETVARALDAGLPFGRFLAGPRDLLAPLTGTPAFRELADRQAVEIVHGPMLGAVTARRARFWVRTAHEVAVSVRVSESGEDERLLTSGEQATRPEGDYTAVLEVTGLRPDTSYDYEVLIAGEPAPGAERASFRTFPGEGSRGRFGVAFGGGAGFTPAHERIWDTIAARRPEALLLLGDNVYVDLPESPGAFHRYTYYRRQSRPEFRRLVRSTPVFTIWDDHDAAIDDSWLGPYVDRPGWKRPTLELFRQNWNNPGYGDEEWPGCWFRFSVGDVDFFMLDGRFYRTNPFAASPTMLGPAQKAWLLGALRESRATFKVVVSPVPWEFGSKPGSRDTWNGFPEERREIFSFLAAEKVAGVLLLSADRHRSEAWRIEAEAPYPLYELSSSRLTNVHFHEPVPGALFSYNETCSFGLVTFDTERDDPEARYEVVDIDGRVVHSLTVKRSALAAR